MSNPLKLYLEALVSCSVWVLASEFRTSVTAACVFNLQLKLFIFKDGDSHVVQTGLDLAQLKITLNF